MFLLRIWIWLVSLAAMACGPFISAQDEEIARFLLINDLDEESGLCTRQEALEFYASFDGIEPVIDSVVEIEDEQSLLDWISRYEDWQESGDQSDPDRIPCYGVVIRWLELDRDVKYLVLLYLTEGEAAFQEHASLIRARAIAGEDPAAIAAGELPDVEWQLNRAYMELELCTIKQAIAYYETLDAYVYETRKAAEIKDSESLKEWVGQFEAWRLEAWSPFLDQPCGVLEIVINTYKTMTYSIALIRQTRFADAYVGVVDVMVEAVLDLVETEMSAIRALQDE